MVWFRFLSVSHREDTGTVGSQAGHLAIPLRKVGLRRRASWRWENPAFQTAVHPVISRTSPSKLGKSLVFHEIVMFLMLSDRFTSKPKNRDFFVPKAGGGKKSGAHTVTRSGKAERQGFWESVGALSSQPGVSVRREQAVFKVLCSSFSSFRGPERLASVSRSLQTWQWRRLPSSSAPGVASLPEPAAPPRVPAPRGVSLQEPSLLATGPRPCGGGGLVWYSRSPVELVVLSPPRCSEGTQIPTPASSAALIAADPMGPRGTAHSVRAPLSWLLLLLSLQVAVPAGALAETLLDAPRARGASSNPPSPASVVAPGTTPFEESRLPVFTLDYPHVQIPFEITLWILLASLAKIGFHLYHKLPTIVPESCLLIMVGLLLGGIIFGVDEKSPPAMKTDVFFLYLLPPIVLDAGYFMPTRPFFENFGTIFWYAVVGTLWNSIGIGVSLFGICQIEAFGLSDITLLQNLLFGSLISAVDPVAVLAVFENIHVNEQLYILVFGESLLNDAVTVVLYNLFKSFCQMKTIQTVDVFAGIANFFVVGIGGVLIGILLGFIAAFTTRFTHNIRVIEPLFVFLYSYLSYITAEMFHLSGIMAITACAMTMNKYVEENVSQKSYTTIKYFMKMLSSVSETLIFIFMGVSTVGKNHEWNWAFVCFTLAFCLIWRALGVFVLTQVINWFRTIPLTFKDQFIIAYGGLRGAICFALVFLLPATVFPRKKLFITAAIVVIFFTVFILGITIRPLVEFLDVKRSNKKQQAVSEEIHCRFFDHVKTGIEDVCGHWGHNFWRDKFKKFDDKYLRKLLIRENQPKSSIVSLYKKLEIKHAIEMAETGMISTVPSFASLNDCREEKIRKLTPGEMDEIREILSRNLYQIRQRTLSYNRHNLTADTSERQAKEILIRRRHSLRESLRKDNSSNRERRASTSTSRYLSLPKNTKLPEKLQKKKKVSNADGNSSDSDPDGGTTVLNLQPRTRRFLPDQFSKKASQAYKMEWKNEVDVGSVRVPPSVSPAPRSKEGGTQTPGLLRQPLLSKDQRFGRGREDSLTEDVPPKPPPRLVRRASEPGNRKGRLGNEKP